MRYYIYIIQVFIFIEIFISSCKSEETIIDDNTIKIGYSVTKIWDNGKHQAFTSLTKFKDIYYCAFREGKTHLFDSLGKAEGKIRIIYSKNSREWDSLPLISIPNIDLRDPKLSVTPDGKLMLSIGGSIYVDKQLQRQIPLVCFSSDGQNFSSPKCCVINSSEKHKTDWIWRVTWKDDKCFGIDYYNQEKDTRGLWLLKSIDGINYDVVTELDVPDLPNEATIRFTPDSGNMVVLIRREGGDGKAYICTSPPPYVNFEYKKIPVRVGGPDFIMLNDSLYLSCHRNYYIEGSFNTSVFIGNINSGRYYQTLVLPSDGDTSYPGLMLNNEEIWITYYSAHETENPCIYLACIPIDMFLGIFNYEK